MNNAALKRNDLPNYCYEDYKHWEGRWELIEGIPFAMVPAPTKKHQRLSLNIAAQLDAQLGKCPKCTTYLPIDWLINEHTVVQPDVLVVCGDPGDDEVKLTTTPELVFEVLSPSSVHKDRVIKYRLYEQAGVKYYGLVDPETDSVEIFTLDQDKFKQSGNFADGRVEFDLGFCRVDLDFGRVFAG